VLASFADVIAHLATRYTLSGGGPSWVEMWWKLEVDGERVVQHQVIDVEYANGLSIVITADVHCRDPLRVRWDGVLVAAGELALDGGRPMLRQPVIAETIDAGHLDRVMEAVAVEAARLARLVRVSRAA
jgi:hypothetical protein